MTAATSPSRSQLLEPALSAAHRCLVRLDDADLTPVQRSIARTSIHHGLPPPLTQRLLRELEGEWLRTLAREELGAGSSTAHEASRLYLERPSGWQERLDTLERASAVARAREAAVEEHRRVEDLERLVADLSHRLEEADARVEAAAAEAEHSNRRERDRLRGRIHALEKAVAAAAEDAAELEVLVERLRGELLDADARVASLRRRAAPRVPDGGVSQPHRSFGRGAPRETARMLDELVEALRPPAHTAAEIGTRERPLLPPGVRPDGSAALEWLLSYELPSTVLVDGHNVAHDLATPPDRAARDRVVLAAAALRRNADGALAPVVFFDTSLDEEAYRSWGVEVRFVDDADRAIVEAAAAATGTVIVVSTDRELRTRAEAAGALALWGSAFSQWILRR